MKWKDSDDNEQSADETQEGYFEEEYSPLKRRNFNFGFNGSALLKNPVIWVAAGACVLIILLIIFMSRSGDTVQQPGVLEDRLGQLEKRIDFMEEITGRLSALEKDLDSKPLMVRLERLETSIAKKLSDMEEKINQMTHRNAVTAAVPDTKAGTGQTGERTHIVQKGDTLYGISKKYGLNVEQLRKLNNLRQGSPIQPGQKLRVK